MKEQEIIGLTDKEVEESRKNSGSNALTQIPPVPLWKKILAGFKDPMIIILIVAMLVQLLLFIFGEAEWYEPVCIFIAIIIANGVSSFSESKQESRAGALKADEEAKQLTKAVRNGGLSEVHVNDIVAGDIVYLQAGDKIPADGFVVKGTIKVDQAALNGETEEIEKTPVKADEEYDKKDLLNPCYVYRGTVVCSGEGYIKTDVVGDRTLFGQLALEVQEETRQTPLQVKLKKLAKQISVFGYVGAACIFVSILLIGILGGNVPANFAGWIRIILEAVTVAVTVIVCAVPEGLPMLTSILMSFQSLRMIKDNVLVRKINGIETAGSISLLYSDKTGTITEGRLSVVEIAAGNAILFKKLDEMPMELSSNIIAGIGINNSASVSCGEVIGGNSTDRALMSFLVSCQCDSEVSKQDTRDFDPFNSEKKCSSITVHKDGKDITYIKGAPERILGKCVKYIDEKGKECEFTDRNYLDMYIDGQAARSMRLLAVAMVVEDEEKNTEARRNNVENSSAKNAKTEEKGTGACLDAQNGNIANIAAEDKKQTSSQKSHHKKAGIPEGLTLVCVLSIRDNVRQEAVQAIKEVKDAGIQVVMVTGDRKETAAAIAKDAGLLQNYDEIALTSAELAEKSDEEVKEILPKMRVVARALPTDKSRLVRLAQESGHVVGMTGDGVNDSPALKKADVGFAMGSGTEVAKEAGEITILDDNFSSIDKAILYGRTMYKSIRKFLAFQLTVNVAAVFICFLGPLFGENVVLTVVQLLLINLAMDTLAAIAFATEPALKEYMKEKPVARDAGIVSRDMLIRIIIGAAYITFICLGILFIPFIRDMFGDVDTTYLKSAVFATFMMSITFNGFNARTEHINPLYGIGKNKTFLLIMLVIFAAQFVFVTFGGPVLSVECLSLESWIICIIMAIIIIPIDMIRKAVIKALQKKSA